MSFISEWERANRRSREDRELLAQGKKRETHCEFPVEQARFFTDANGQPKAVSGQKLTCPRCGGKFTVTRGGLLRTHYVIVEVQS